MDGRTALLSYDQASIGGRSLTVLQYAIAAPAGRACYTTLVTEQGPSYEPAFSQLRPGIQVLTPPLLPERQHHSAPPFTAGPSRQPAAQPSPAIPMPR